MERIISTGKPVCDPYFPEIYSTSSKKKLPRGGRVFYDQFESPRLAKEMHSRDDMRRDSDADDEGELIGDSLVLFPGAVQQGPHAAVSTEFMPVAGTQASDAIALAIARGFLGPQTIGRVACVSRQAGALMEDDNVWKALCRRDFGILYRADRYATP